MATYEVRWWTAGRKPSVAQLRIAGTRATLSGTPPYSFDLRHADAVLVTPEPAVHVRVRRRGWLIMSALGGGVTFELATALAQLT